MNILAISRLSTTEQVCIMDCLHLKIWLSCKEELSIMKRTDIPRCSRLELRFWALLFLIPWLMCTTFNQGLSDSMFSSIKSGNGLKIINILTFSRASFWILFTKIPKKEWVLTSLEISLVYTKLIFSKRGSSAWHPYHRRSPVRIITSRISNCDCHSSNI